MQSSYRIIKSKNFNIVEEKDIPLKDHGYLSEVTYSTTQANSLMQIAKQEAMKMMNDTEEFKKEIHEKILQESRPEIEIEKQRAYEVGMKIGKKEGYDIGYSDGFQTVKDEYQEVIDSVNVEYRSAIEKVGKLILSSNEKIIELSIKIASEIIKKEIEVDDSIIVGITQSILHEVRKFKHINIRVNSKDKKVMDEEISLFQGICPGAYITIMIDNFLPSGNCIVETDSHMIDAKIDVQLENIKRALLEVRI